jgi:hypothetical protein
LVNRSGKPTRARYENKHQDKEKGKREEFTPMWLGVDIALSGKYFRVNAHD